MAEVRNPWVGWLSAQVSGVCQSFVCRSERMSRFRLLTIFMSGMLGTATLPDPVASAPVLNPANRNGMVEQNELLMLENRLRRQQYQQQQQQFPGSRDRAAATARSTAYLPATAVKQRLCEHLPLMRRLATYLGGHSLCASCLTSIRGVF
ncbi:MULTISPECIES: hypothetical protein [Mesorhizobium]|uniref:hypothetical protein n=1 Tax=Mesorhizobium TaxID=68287 RepID=UPI001FE23FD8|nr:MULTISPECIES: hypothetical protein [Mesorhizobium]